MDKEKSNVTTIKRNWLNEAYLIAQGNRDISPKKEHVEAAISCLVGFSNDVEKLRGLMRLAYDEACKRRAENGLPIPPKPPGLDQSVELPWNK